MAFIKRAQSKFKVEQVYSYSDLQEGLVKVAGKNVTAKVINKISSIPAIQAEPDNYLYIRNRSVSGLDTWGFNSNFDAFPSEELQSAYKTFVRVGISVDHINNGEEDLIGLVLDSEYVPKQLYCINDNTLFPFSEEKRASLIKEGKKLKVVGDYVENLLCIDKKLANEKRAGLVQAILNGEVTDTSMGTSVQESECSICGNVARGEHEYCEHIKCKRCGNRAPKNGEKECLHSNDKGRMISYNGHNPKYCYEINRGLDFFEDSIILSETFAKKSGATAQAGGEGADTGAKILEVVANKKPSILDEVKKRANVGTLSDDTIVIGEEPKELEQKREEYEESREDYFEDGKTSMKIEDKDITASTLKSIAKNKKDYSEFENEVSKVVGSISTPSRIKLRSFYKTFQERHRDEVLAVAKHIVDTQDGINQESLKERLASHGFNQKEIDEALAYQVKVKGNYDVSSKLKNFLVEGMKLYNEIDKTADLQGANYANTMNTGLAELVDRYNDSKMDDSGDLNETKGADGKNYIGSEPIGETRSMKKTADLKNEILQFVNGQTETPKENIFGRFGYQPEVNQAIDDLVSENKVTVDEFESVHPVTDDINNAGATAEAQENVSVVEPSETDSFANVEAFEKYLVNPQSDWVILSATDQSKTTDANGNSIPAYLNPENIEANQKLLTDIKALGFDAVEAQGVYLNSPEGKSYLVDGASLKDGVFLGLKYNQESILIPQGIYTLPKAGSENIKSPNDVSEALIHQGELAPATTSGNQPKVYWGDLAKEQDGYTMLSIGGEDVAFSFDIDWNGIKPFGQYLSKTSGLVEDEAKDAQEVKDDAEIIKYTDEDLTKESKNTMIERLELTARRLNKAFEKFAGIDMNKHIWEGWTVGNFIEELEPSFDMIMRGQSHQEPFKTVAEVKKWCMENQPYYKKYIPDVVSYFWNKVQQNSNNRFAKKDSDKVKQDKMDIGGVGSPDSDGHYNTEEMDLSQGSGDPANYKDLKKNQDSEFTTDEDGMVQKVKALQQKLASGAVNNNLMPSSKGKCSCGRSMSIGEATSGVSPFGYVCPDCKHRKHSPTSREDYYKQFGITDNNNNNKLGDIKSHLSELTDDRVEDAEKDKEDYGFEMNDEILDDKEIKGNMEDTLKDKKSNRMFEDYDKEKPEKEEDEVEETVKEAKNAFEKMNNAMTLDATPLNLDSENSSSLGTETDNLGNEDQSGIGKIMSFLKDTMSAMDDFDTPEPMDYSIKTDEDGVKDFENKTASIKVDPTKFKSGFQEGDRIDLDDQHSSRYVVVRDGFNRTFIVADNGERRMQIVDRGNVRFDPPLNKPALKGNLSLSDILSKKTAGTIPYNINPNDPVEVKNETGGTETTGTVTDVKEEVNPDGSTSPTVEMSDGKTYPADEHMIQKTMNKSAKLLELETMDFGDSEKLSKLAKLEVEALEVPELIITSAVQDSTEADAMISDNEAGEVFDSEPVVKRSAIKPKVNNGFTINTHGSLKPRNAELNIDNMWDE